MFENNTNNHFFCLEGSYYGKFNLTELIHAFQVFDPTKKGFIDEKDLDEMFRKLNWHEKFNANEILKKMDYNNDGKVCIKGKNQT